MTLCPNCGKDLKENAKFCASCGQPVKRRETERRKGITYIDDDGDEVILIPIYDKKDRAVMLEWLKDELYAEDYYETVYGPDHDSPVKVVNEPVSGLDNYRRRG